MRILREVVSHRYLNNEVTVRKELSLDRGSVFLGKLSIKDDSVILTAKRIDVDGGVEEVKLQEELDLVFKVDSFETKSARETFGKLQKLAKEQFNAQLFTYAKTDKGDTRIKFAVYTNDQVEEIDSLSGLALPF